MLLNLVLEKTLEGPLDFKEIQSVYPKENQYWIFIGRTDAEAETPILWPPNAKNRLIRKDPDAGKDWKQEEKGITEDEMVGWHQKLNGHGFGWTPGWWGTGRSGVLRFMGSQRVGHDWVTELNWGCEWHLNKCKDYHLGHTLWPQGIKLKIFTKKITKSKHFRNLKIFLNNSTNDYKLKNFKPRANGNNTN